MIRTVIMAAAIATVFTVAPGRADDVTVGSLKISAAWTRATPKGAPVGGGYMTITNTGSAPDRLVGGASDASKRFEIHAMSMDNGVMRMRPVKDGLEIKPGQTVKLDPGGYHIMFVGLDKPFEQGRHIKATLDFAKAGKVDIDFTVEGMGAMSPGGAHGGMQMKH